MWRLTNESHTELYWVDMRPHLVKQFFYSFEEFCYSCTLHLTEIYMCFIYVVTMEQCCTDNKRDKKLIAYPSFQNFHFIEVYHHIELHVFEQSGVGSRDTVRNS